MGLLVPTDTSQFGQSTEDRALPLYALCPVDPINHVCQVSCAPLTKPSIKQTSKQDHKKNKDPRLWDVSALLPDCFCCSFVGPSTNTNKQLFAVQGFPTMCLTVFVFHFCCFHKHFAKEKNYLNVRIRSRTVWPV